MWHARFVGRWAQQECGHVRSVEIRRPARLVDRSQRLSVRAAGNCTDTFTWADGAQEAAFRFEENRLFSDHAIGASRYGATAGVPLGIWGQVFLLRHDAQMHVHALAYTTHRWLVKARETVHWFTVMAVMVWVVSSGCLDDNAGVWCEAL